MALTTYAELKASIADFLNRDDLTSVIPDFITLAEADMNRGLRHWRQEKRLLGLTAAHKPAQHLSASLVEPSERIRRAVYVARIEAGTVARLLPWRLPRSGHKAEDRRIRHELATLRQRRICWCRSFL